MAKNPGLGPSHDREPRARGGLTDVHALQRDRASMRLDHTHGQGVVLAVGWHGECGHVLREVWAGERQPVSPQHNVVPLKADLELRRLSVGMTWARPNGDEQLRCANRTDVLADAPPLGQRTNAKDLADCAGNGDRRGGHAQHGGDAKRHQKHPRQRNHRSAVRDYRLRLHRRGTGTHPTRTIPASNPRFTIWIQKYAV